MLLSMGTAPAGPVDVLVNLAADVPACVAAAQRVAEFIDGDPARRQAGRSRFRAYKDRGVQPIRTPRRYRERLSFRPALPPGD